MLFLYASSNFSFRILAAAACAIGISAISDTAWRKRFSKAAPFLREILHSLLSAFLPATDISAFDGVKNVLLADASVIRQNGKQQHQQRIHLCYSLNENRMKQVKASDQHTAESPAHFSMKKGDLVMADAGYGTAQNFIYAQEQGADVILRITPKNFCLYDAQGESRLCTGNRSQAPGWTGSKGKRNVKPAKILKTSARSRQKRCSAPDGSRLFIP